MSQAEPQAGAYSPPLVYDISEDKMRAATQQDVDELQAIATFAGQLTQSMTKMLEHYLDLQLRLTGERKLPERLQARLGL